MDRNHLDGVRGLSHWCIVGGESGPKCRPMADEWARELRDQCAEAGIAFFLKQLGGFPDKRGHDAATLDEVSTGNAKRGTYWWEKQGR